MKLLLVLALAVVAAVVGTAAAQSANGRSVDLTNGLVDGHPVLGRTVAGVTAALGRPDFRVRDRVRYKIGWGTPSDFSLMVLFRRSNGALRAWSVVFERGPVRDKRIGELLGRPPVSLRDALRRRYADQYELARNYRCRSSGLCSGEFAQRAGPLHLTFGRNRVRGTWLTIWEAA